MNAGGITILKIYALSDLDFLVYHRTEGAGVVASAASS